MTRKFDYMHVVQGNYGYGHGWEDLTQSENRAEMLEDLKRYRQDERGYGEHRIIRRRVPHV